MRRHIVTFLFLGLALFLYGLGAAGPAIGFLALGLIDLRDAIEHVSTHVARNTRGIGKIQNGIACAAKLYPLVLGRKKSASPQAIVQGLGLASAL